METEKESSKNNTKNGSSSLPRAIHPKTKGGNGAKATKTTASAPTAEAKSPPTDTTSTSKNKGPCRQSTRSVKATKPFSPPMGGIKGVSSTAKKALARNKGSLSNVSLNDPEHQRRFMPLLYDLIEETHNENQDIISWSRDGKSFVMNTDHEDLEQTIERFFGRKFVCFSFSTVEKIDCSLNVLPSGWDFCCFVYNI